MKLYVVRNRLGKYFRVGNCWVDELDEAKIYPKRGVAAGRVTYFAKHHPSYGVPNLLEFDIDASKALLVDMEPETNKKLYKAKQLEIKRKIAHKEWEKAHLEAKRKELQAQLDKLNGKI